MTTNQSSKGVEKAASDINKAIKATAEKLGLKSYVLAFDQQGMLTTHFEQIAMSTASRAIIALFQQLCRFEASNKTYSQEYRRAFTELEADFMAMIAAFNKRLDGITNSAGKTKAS